MGHHHAHSTLGLILSKHLDPFICYRVPVGGLEILGKARRFGLGGGRARRLLQAGAIVAALWNKELAIKPTFLSCHPHHHVASSTLPLSHHPRRLLMGQQLVAGQCPGQVITRASLLGSSVGTQSLSATRSQGGSVCDLL